MATKLDKTVIRETEIIIENRNLVISLTDDQKISFKLKGMKTKSCEATIEDIFNGLMGEKPEVKPRINPEGPLVIKVEEAKQEKAPKGSNYINVQDFRSKVLISSDLSYDIKVKLEGILKDL